MCIWEELPEGGPELPPELKDFPGAKYEDRTKSDRDA